MYTIVRRPVLGLSLLVSILCLVSCHTNSQDSPPTVAQRNELSATPAVRLSGIYSCIRLQLENGYTEGRGQLKGTGYSVSIQAKGDSIQLALTGDGTAGRFNNLDLGTYAVEFTSIGGASGDYYTVKKDILTDFTAVTVIDRTVGGVSARQITYSFPITLYQFLPQTCRANQYTPMKASDIFSTTQKVVGIFSVERVLSTGN